MNQIELSFQKEAHWQHQNILKYEINDQDLLEKLIEMVKKMYYNKPVPIPLEICTPFLSAYGFYYQLKQYYQICQASKNYNTEYLKTLEELISQLQNYLLLSKINWLPDYKISIKGTEQEKQLKCFYEIKEFTNEFSEIVEIVKQNYGAFIYEQKYNIINSLMKKDGMILLPIHYITKNNIKHLIVMLVKLQSHPDSKYSMTIEVYNAGFQSKNIRKKVCNGKTIYNSKNLLSEQEIQEIYKAFLMYTPQSYYKAIDDEKGGDIPYEIADFFEAKVDINSTVPMQEQYAYNCTIYSLKVYFMLNGMSDIIERVINFKDTPHEKILSGIQDDEIIEYSMNLQEDNDVSYITVCNSKSPKKMQLLNTDFKGIIGKVCKQHQNQQEKKMENPKRFLNNKLKKQWNY